MKLHSSYTQKDDLNIILCSKEETSTVYTNAQITTQT